MNFHEECEKNPMKNAKAWDVLPMLRIMSDCPTAKWRIIFTNTATASWIQNLAYTMLHNLKKPDNILLH